MQSFNKYYTFYLFIYVLEDLLSKISSKVNNLAIKPIPTALLINVSKTQGNNQSNCYLTQLIHNIAREIFA